MSKEITPKGALDELCDLATPNGDCLNYVIGLSGIILKALDRLELLEKENQELRNKLNINFEDCADELCEALTQRDKLYDENLELQKENQELKEKAKKYDELCLHNVMGNQSFGDDLIQGILALNKRVIERNKKQVKVIAWLKNTFEITLDSKVRISDGTDCIQAFPIDLKTNEVIYDLLKEVLE